MADIPTVVREVLENELSLKVESEQGESTKLQLTLSGKPIGYVIYLDIVELPIKTGYRLDGS